MLNIVLFGPPGAGKGTHSERLVHQFNLFYISTGELLRKEIADGTPLGEQAEGAIARGGLVSDEIIVQVIEKTIRAHPDSNGFLFDGFPRTYIQAYILEGLMIRLNTSLTCLINLRVPEAISTRRLIERGKTSGRSDDNEEVIQNRMREYSEKTIPLLQFYKDKGIYREVDATLPIDDVNRRIVSVIQEELRKTLFNVVLFGYPGSGCRSQGQALAKRFGLEYVATGPMLEAEIQSGSPLGQRIKKLYDNGQLVPDEIVVPLIEQRIESAPDVRGFLFKGFPRTLVQSYILDGLLRKHDSEVSKAIELEVPAPELMRRLDDRSKTDWGRGPDGHQARIRQRLHDHEVKTLPVIEKYNQRHSVTRIDGNRTFEDVFSAMSRELEASLTRMV